MLLSSPSAWDASQTVTCLDVSSAGMGMGATLLSLALVSNGTPPSLLQRQICVITTEGKTAT